MSARTGRFAAPSRDLPNARLIAIVALSLAAGLFLAVGAPSLPGAWGRPGGPLLQAAAALGALLLFASFAAVLAKRRGRPGKRAFHGHVWLASIGSALVFAHAAGNFDRPPALMFLLLAILMALGVWSRIGGARRMASTFGQKRAAFGAPDPDRRARLASVLQAKRDLLAKLDPAAAEATFSLTPRHWRRAPLKAVRYQALVDQEAHLTGARAALSPLQAYWRRVHHGLAMLFLIGLLVHIAVVMIFAGYAADGGEIYWLHFADWDF